MSDATATPEFRHTAPLPEPAHPDHVAEACRDYTRATRNGNLKKAELVDHATYMGVRLEDGLLKAEISELLDTFAEEVREANSPAREAGWRARTAEQKARSLQRMAASTAAKDIAHELANASSPERAARTMENMGGYMEAVAKAAEADAALARLEHRLGGGQEGDLVEALTWLHGRLLRTLNESAWMNMGASRSTSATHNLMQDCRMKARAEIVRELAWLVEED